MVDKLNMCRITHVLQAFDVYANKMFRYDDKKLFVEEYW